MRFARELRERRAGILDEARAILDRAEKAGKAVLDAEDARKYDALVKDADALSVEIERRERLDEHEAEQARSLNPHRAGREGDTTDRPHRTASARPNLVARTVDGRELPILRPDQRVADHVERRGGGPEIGLGEILRGTITGRWRSEEARQWSNVTPSAGGVLIPPGVSATVIDLARAKTRVVEAGAMTIPLPQGGDVTIAKVTADPTTAWRGPNQPIPASKPTFGGVKFQPRTLGCLMKLPLELVEDAVNVDAVAESVLAEAIGVEIDRVALVGTGASEEPLGIENTPSVGTATSVGSPVWDDLVDAQTTVRNANGEPTAAILAPRDVGTLAKLKGSANDHYIAPPEEIRNLRRLTTTLVPTNRGGGSNESLAFVGDFANLWLGIRTEITIEASRQAGDASGSAFRDLQAWIRAYIRMDVAVVRANHFVVLSGITA